MDAWVDRRLGNTNSGLRYLSGTSAALERSHGIFELENDRRMRELQTNLKKNVFILRAASGERAHRILELEMGVGSILAIVYVESLSDVKHSQTGHHACEVVFALSCRPF